MRRTSIKRLFTVLIVTAATIGAGASLASATQPDPGHKVTICHATASASNPYVVITVDTASIVGGSGHGHSGVNAGDIIPSFPYDGGVYPGINWDDAQHMAIWENGCNGETPTTNGNE